MNANRTPEQIEADINDVRERMDSTLDTLEQRLDAKQLIRDGLDHLRNSDTIRYVTMTAASAGRVAREHPVPAAIAGASLLGLIVWGLRSGTHSERNAMRHVSDAVNTARDRLLSAKQTLADSTREARRRTLDAAGHAWKEIEQAGGEARSVVREHPVATSAVGLVLIAAIAAAAALPGVRNRLGR